MEMQEQEVLKKRAQRHCRTRNHNRKSLGVQMGISRSGLSRIIMSISTPYASYTHWVVTCNIAVRTHHSSRKIVIQIYRGGLGSMAVHRRPGLAPPKLASCRRSGGARISSKHPIVVFSVQQLFAKDMRLIRELVSNLALLALAGEDIRGD